MFFEVLRAFKRLATEVATMRLQRDMDANVRCDVVTLYHRNIAVGPSTLQVEIIGALATDMDFAHMVLEVDELVFKKQGDGVVYIEGFSTLSPLAAALPEALEGVIAVAVTVAAVRDVGSLLLQLWCYSRSRLKLILGRWLLQLLLLLLL